MWEIGIELTLEQVVQTDEQADHPADLRDFLRCAYAELCRLDSVTDPELSATLAEGRATFTAFVKDGDCLEAVVTFASAVRTALHSAGALTAGWSEQIEAALARAEVRTGHALVPA